MQSIVFQAAMQKAWKQQALKTMPEALADVQANTAKDSRDMAAASELPINIVLLPLRSIKAPDSILPGKLEKANKRALKYTFSKCTATNKELIHVKMP